MFKKRNFNQVKTTILAVIGGALIVAGVIWPDEVTPENSQDITANIDTILVSIGGLIETLTLMFGARDG